MLQGFLWLFHNQRWVRLDIRVDLGKVPPRPLSTGKAWAHATKPGGEDIGLSMAVEGTPGDGTGTETLSNFDLEFNMLATSLAI